MDIETGQNNDKLHIDKEITSIIQRYSMFEKMKFVQTYHKQPVPFLVFKTCWLLSWMLSSYEDYYLLVILFFFSHVSCYVKTLKTENLKPINQKDNFALQK